MCGMSRSEAWLLDTKCGTSSAVSLYTEDMEVDLTPEQQLQLIQIAGKIGTAPERLVANVVARFLDQEARLWAAGQNGIGAGGQAFFAAKTITQLIAEQGVQPVQDIAALSGAIPDADLDEFVADIYRDRKD